jgi:hypothetical protein
MAPIQAKLATAEPREGEGCGATRPHFQLKVPQHSGKIVGIGRTRLPRLRLPRGFRPGRCAANSSNEPPNYRTASIVNDLNDAFTSFHSPEKQSLVALVNTAQQNHVTYFEPRSILKATRNWTRSASSGADHADDGSRRRGPFDKIEPEDASGGDQSATNGALSIDDSRNNSRWNACCNAPRHAPHISILAGADRR